MKIEYIVPVAPRIEIVPVPTSVVLRVKNGKKVLERITWSMFWLSIIGFMVLCAVEVYETILNNRVLAK